MAVATLVAVTQSTVIDRFLGDYPSKKLKTPVSETVSTREEGVMGKLFTLVLAAGAISITACDRSPTEERADNVEAAAENRADAVEEQAANRAESIEEQAENRAEEIRDAGQNEAEAIRNTDTE